MAATICRFQFPDVAAAYACYDRRREMAIALGAVRFRLPLLLGRIVVACGVMELC